MVLCSFGGQRGKLGVFCACSLLHFLRQGLSLNLELMHLIRLDRDLSAFTPSASVTDVVLCLPFPWMLETHTGNFILVWPAPERLHPLLSLTHGGFLPR